MRVLKILYIIWAVFIGFIILYGILYIDKEFFTKDNLRGIFFLYSYPLLPYLSYLTLKKITKSKTFLSSLLIYCCLFLSILVYFCLFIPFAADFLVYIVALSIYAISFLIVSFILRKEFSFYFFVFIARLSFVRILKMKKAIDNLKDYLDCADASYALLNYQVKSGEKKCL